MATGLNFLSDFLYLLACLSLCSAGVVDLTKDNFDSVRLKCFCARNLIIIFLVIDAGRYIDSQLLHF